MCWPASDGGYATPYANECLQILLVLHLFLCVFQTVCLLYGTPILGGILTSKRGSKPLFNCHGKSVPSLMVKNQPLEVGVFPQGSLK